VCLFDAVYIRVSGDGFLVSPAVFIMTDSVLTMNVFVISFLNNVCNILVCMSLYAEDLLEICSVVNHGPMLTVCLLE